MKSLLILIALCGVFNSSFGNKIDVLTINSIEEFKKQNPDVQLVELVAYDHHLDLSRTYSLGQRQTGKFISGLLDSEQILIFHNSRR